MVSQIISKAKKSRGGASFIPAFLFYITGVISESWRLVFYNSEYFSQTVKPFICVSYRAVAPEFTLYMYIRLLANEIAPLSFSICFLYLINKIRTTYRSARVTEVNMVRLIYFTQTISIGIFAWAFMDTIAFLWNYKTSEYFYVYIIVEIVIFLYRLWYRTKQPQL